MPWTIVDTVRCERCAVFTPVDDILHATNGDAYCTTCGPPPVSVRPPARLKKHPVFVTAAVVCAVVAGFFVAACASQL